MATTAFQTLTNSDVGRIENEVSSDDRSIFHTCQSEQGDGGAGVMPHPILCLAAFLRKPHTTVHIDDRIMTQLLHALG